MGSGSNRGLGLLGAWLLLASGCGWASHAPAEETDAARTERDGGHATVDAGPGEPDAGAVPGDSGSVEPDGGVVASDSGVTAPDGGTVDRSPWVGISAGTSQTCAWTRDGRAFCWGASEWGQRGDGTIATRRRPEPVVGLADVAELSTDESHTCARRRDGSVACWGLARGGKLGHGRPGPAPTTCWDGTHDCWLTPREVVGVTDAVQVVVGNGISCARRPFGALLCWGGNEWGQLGDGTTLERHTPVEVGALTDVTDVGGGWRHTCAVRSAGVVVCWGYNEFGQVGNGGVTGSPWPERVVGISDAVAVSAGIRHSCALRSDGGVACWGSNWTGQLGDGLEDHAILCGGARFLDFPDSPSDCSLTPVEVDGLDDAVQLSVGKNHACALRSTGEVVCWGLNADRQLGRRGGSSSIPVSVPGIVDAVQVSAGWGHSCALVASGPVVCWGSNNVLQLGEIAIDGPYAGRGVTEPPDSP